MDRESLWHLPNAKTIDRDDEKNAHIDECKNNWPTKIFEKAHKKSTLLRGTQKTIFFLEKIDKTSYIDRNVRFFISKFGKILNKTKQKSIFPRLGIQNHGICQKFAPKHVIMKMQFFWNYDFFLK